jgi:peptide chain release factor 1
MLEKLQTLEERFESITEEMARPEVVADYQRLQVLAKERASIEDVVSLYRDLRSVTSELEDTRSLINEGSDPDLVHLAREEAATLEEKESRLQEQIKLALLPRDPHDDRDVIVEVRAGTGGEEAGLFAGDLFRMYSRYAERKRWGVEVLSANESEKGGYKEIVFEVNGKGAYSRFKFESGVHRVQRVPATETQGRVHTSAATVAVLPEAEDIEVDVDEKELKWDVFHSGGAGGQNVNKVATAVRVTHLPTGIVVQCQDERSQLKNKTKALMILKSRLLQIREEEQAAQISDSRRSQVGGGDRSEKIRTYNFQQDRVTDHRVGLTRHNLQAFLDGEIDDVIDAVATADQAQRLEESLD